ncbi:La domain containing protein [Histomonas meleagridis]|uniref:La domain containing protein n=1 Tax=Histomonas meleagridis TaxID=135588 RepID=UPI00355A318F|nr:La domain containing protein [Histomonas meleagridis]KAH0797827.1 La domain containing protein [Histomonas meleagridis]
MIKRLGSLFALDKEAEGKSDDFEMTDIMQSAKDQIEFYLCNTNLDNDEFMREQVLKTKDRYVNVNVFMNCKRIKQIGITSDDLLLACSHSHFLEVDMNNQRIRSKVPYSKDVRRKFRSVRVCGLNKDITVDNLYDIFIAEAEEPESIIFQYTLNDDGDRIFTGSAIVVFFSEAAADQALAAPLYDGDKKLSLEILGDYKKKRNIQTKRSNL